MAAPTVWDCPRCGLPAGQDAQDPPGRTRAEPYKTHLAYVKERRTDAEGRRSSPRPSPPCVTGAAGVITPSRHAEGHRRECRGLMLTQWL
ncbi:hypothetical protein GCM10029963_69730 [Micromonospora andamanensis]